MGHAFAGSTQKEMENGEIGMADLPGKSGECPTLSCLWSLVRDLSLPFYCLEAFGPRLLFYELPGSAIMG